MYTSHFYQIKLPIKVFLEQTRRSKTVLRYPLYPQKYLALKKLIFRSLEPFYKAHLSLLSPFMDKQILIIQRNMRHP